MIKKLTLLLFVVLCGALCAQPHSFSDKGGKKTSSAAITAATRYLSIQSDGAHRLLLRETLNADDGTPAIYIFDIDDHGFIIVSAYTFAPPVIGWSLEGTFCRDSLPPALLDYIEDYRHDIAAIAAGAYVDESTASDCRDEWTALLSSSDAAKRFYASRGSKNQSQLLSTQWNQGSGYNNYCPADSNGRRAVTGCVATAMAQIIRYYQYPATGFGTSTYAHMVYGRLTAVHDSVIYDYSAMPSSVNERSPAAQQHAVSLLCFHCGVALRMDYQSYLNTSGSGAFVTSVPEYIQHFGYFRSHFHYKSDMSLSSWHAMLRHELDQRRPILYQGHSAEGGHAFVCDGYKENDATYHFNWGWGGHGDGYYTLTTMQGFTGAQGGVFGIYPSGLVPGCDTIYVQPGSYNGNGSTWYNASNDLVSAIRARGLYKKGEVWVREGHYIGDTALGARAAFTLMGGVKVYGGFAGNETSIDQRRPSDHPSILDGRGFQRVVHCPNLNKEAKIANFHITGGNADEGAGIYASSDLTVDNCSVSYCSATTGSAIYSRGAILRNCILQNNNGRNTLYIERGSAKNMLIANNNGDGCRISDASITGSDIVSNNGCGVTLAANALMRNCIVWNNSTQLSGAYTPDSVRFNAIGAADEGSNGPDSLGNIGLSKDNYADRGPHFVYATPRGPYARGGNWHLAPGSPCIDAADTTRSGNYPSDLDGTLRTSHRRIDMGCYEYVGNTQGINAAAQGTLAIYPNPCHSTAICCDITPGASVSVYNISGRCVYRTTPTSSTATLQLPAPGLYIVRSTDGNTARIISR